MFALRPLLLLCLVQNLYAQRGASSENGLSRMLHRGDGSHGGRGRGNRRNCDDEDTEGEMVDDANDEGMVDNDPDGDGLRLLRGGGGGGRRGRRRKCGQDEDAECTLDCQNGGVCKVWGEMFCRCPDNFEGDNCEIEISPASTSTGTDASPSTTTTTEIADDFQSLKTTSVESAVLANDSLEKEGSSQGSSVAVPVGAGIVAAAVLLSAMMISKRRRTGRAPTGTMPSGQHGEFNSQEGAALT